MFEGAEIGISDIHGRPIRCGDRLRVRHVNYMGQQKEYVAQDVSSVYRVLQVLP
jgi:hypothetical protein